jgi:excisionase family DNA binding protein
MWNEVAPGEKLLTKCEVAQLCRVEIRTVDRWVAAGKLRSYRTPSGRLLFRSSDVLIPESGQSSSTSSGNGSSSDPSGSARPR